MFVSFMVVAASRYIYIYISLCIYIVDVYVRAAFREGEYCFHYMDVSTNVNDPTHLFHLYCVCVWERLFMGIYIYIYIFDPNANSRQGPVE
jgi:hypothetical protein